MLFSPLQTRVEINTLSSSCPKRLFRELRSLAPTSSNVNCCNQVITTLRLLPVRLIEDVVVFTSHLKLFDFFLCRKYYTNLLLAFEQILRELMLPLPIYYRTRIATIEHVFVVVTCQLLINSHKIRIKT